MKVMFQIPTTRLVRVVFTSGNVKYGAVIPNPKDNQTLQMVMLTRKVGMSQIDRIEGIYPIVPRHGWRENLNKHLTNKAN